MKSLHIFRLGLILLTIGTASRLCAQEPQNSAKHPDGIVSVEFAEMAEFTDFGRSPQPHAAGQEALAEELRAEIKRIAPRYIPENRHLELRFLDIDMAGEFEPNIAPGENEVRVVRGVQTPSFLVEYAVKTPDGEVVSKGQRRISDPDFQYIINFRTGDSLFYEIELARELIYDISRSIS